MPFAARGGFLSQPAVASGRTASSTANTGTVNLDTGEYQIGSASAQYPGIGNYTTVTNDGNFTLDKNDFTWEFWFRTDLKSSSFPVLMKMVGNFNTSNSWMGFYDRHGSVHPTKLGVWSTRKHFDETTLNFLESTTSIVNDTWYHVAVTRSGADFELFINGTSEDTYTSTTSGGGFTVDGGTDTDLKIAMGPSTSQNSHNGWIDEVRISSVVRYTSNFTPSSTPFTNDSDTLLLLHFDTDFADDVS